MATKARQQYFADEVSLQKELKEFSIADEIQQKIDSVEEGAQVNTIETIKVNWSEVLPDGDKAIDLTIPSVVDSLDSTSSTDALSARQGKVLYDKIVDVSHIGHFLALWDASTWLPVTNPETSPYVYNTGDFYTISVVASEGATNYRPDWTEFVIWQASTTVETENISVNDFYFYDGQVWRHMVNSWAGSIAIDGSLSTTSINPVENRVITNAINSKADATDTNTKTFYLSSDSDYTNAQAALDWYLAGKNPIIRYNNITWLVEWTYDTSWVPRVLNFRSNQIPIWRSQYLPSTGQSTYILNYQLSVRANTSNTVYNIVFFSWNTIVNFLDTTTNYAYPYIPQYDGSPATKKYVDDNAGKTYIAWANIQISNEDVISATDTKYTAWTWISIDANNVISNTQTSAEWWNITWTLSNQIDLQDALDEKQDKLTAGDNITIENACGYNSQWPMPEGFHIPTSAEWATVKSVWTTMWGRWTDWVGLGNVLKLPRAGFLHSITGNVLERWTTWEYRNCSTISGSYYAQLLYFNSSSFDPAVSTAAATGMPLRPFKNTPVEPDSSWIELYPGIWIWIWIYWSATEGLISLSSDWYARITMSDKNLWATEVWNSWDELTAANCGNYYQWWNNYGFPFTWPTTISTTQVDASGYWPGNYYSSSTYIGIDSSGSGNWDSSRNTNLWWWDNPTWTQCSLTISAQVPKIEVDDKISSISENPVQNKVIKEALDGKVSFWLNKVFDNTVVEIWKWEDEGGVQGSGHNVTISPSGEISTYNATVGWYNEATLWSANLTLTENTVANGDETTVISQDGITITEGQTIQTYNFLWNDRIAKLSDVSGLSDLNTKTFQWYRWVWYLANAQAVYDRISTWKYAIVEVKNGNGDWKWNVVFWPTDVTTGTINSWEYSHTHQSSFGSYYEWYYSLVMEVVDWVVTQAYGSGTALNINGHLVIKSDTAPSSPVQGSMWYDTTNNKLKVYDGTNWNEVGSDAGDINTKTFILQSWTDYTTATEAYEWFASGRNPIVIDASGDVFLWPQLSGSLLELTQIVPYSDTTSSSTRFCIRKIRLQYNSSTERVGWISYSLLTNPFNFLATGVNYSTPYTPQYDGSPATKKYVDDSVAAAAWLQKASSSPLDIKYFWAGTQAQYDALSSYSDNTVYFTV